MKSLISIVLYLFVFVFSQAQDYQINFTGSGQSTSIDSIMVENLTQGTKLTLGGDDVLHLVKNLGINSRTYEKNVVKIYPIPMIESTYVEFDNSNSGSVCIKIFNEMGVLNAKQTVHSHPGLQRFEIMGLNTGIYAIYLSTTDWEYAAKLISFGKNSGNITIKHQCIDYGSISEKVLLKTKDLVQMQYNDGEMILLKGFVVKYARVLTLLPTQSQTVNFEFIPCLDGDGNNYAVVTIGSQTWMAENLNYGERIDGDQIQEDNPVVEKYCYNDEEVFCNTYGGLYQWNEMMQYNTLQGFQGICPTGWHVPTTTEWTILTDYLSFPVGGKLKETGTEHWLSPNGGATNEFGFTALPGGMCIQDTFETVGMEGNWWTSSQASPYNSRYRKLTYLHGLYATGYIIKGRGLSVRCIKD